MKNDNRGFTLIEVIIVMAIIGILVAIAAPSVTQYLTNARYREANQRIHSLLLDARQRAVSLNCPVTVGLNLDTDTYVSSYVHLKDDGITEEVVTVATGKFPAEVEIRGTEDCSKTSGTISIKFNTDGSAGSSTGLYVCIMNGSINKYRAGVNNTSTGRVVSQIWRGGAWH